MRSLAINKFVLVSRHLDHRIIVRFIYGQFFFVKFYVMSTFCHVNVGTLRMWNLLQPMHLEEKIECEPFLSKKICPFKLDKYAWYPNYISFGTNISKTRNWETQKNHSGHLQQFFSQFIATVWIEKILANVLVQSCFYVMRMTFSYVMTDISLT